MIQGEGILENNTEVILSEVLNNRFANMSSMLIIINERLEKQDALIGISLKSIDSTLRSILKEVKK